MSWHDDAICKGQFEFFHDDSVTHKFVDDGVLAKLMCYECPVRGQCLDESLRYKNGKAGKGELSSIWGGFKPNERTKIKKSIKTGKVGFDSFIEPSVSSVALDIVDGF